MVSAQDRRQTDPLPSVREKTMIPMRQLEWLAGWLEGEGSFGVQKTGSGRLACPTVHVGTTDGDVAKKAADIFQTSTNGPYRSEQRTLDGSRLKPVYQVGVVGIKAVGWMMTLYGMLGHRRQAQIRRALIAWKSISTRSEYWQSSSCRRNLTKARAARKAIQARGGRINRPRKQPAEATGAP